MVFFASILIVSLLSAGNYQELSLEELADIPVVESSKTNLQLFDAPNGAFVFDEEAIQNLPVDSIPELLRYAPGVHIMRASNGTWGLGIRGMNSRFLGRALFTVDEQSLYGTIFNGLFGSDHDLPLDDIASIEVVYGPGGTLWGTNAANGRVNVILKSAFETEGSRLKTRIGTKVRSVDARHGWLIGEKSAARVWAKKSHRKSSTDDFNEDWDASRAGVRFDTRPTSEDLVSITAEISESELGTSRAVLDAETGYPEILTAPETQEGTNAQIKWTHQGSADNGYSIRAWTGTTDLRSPYANYDLQHFGTEVRSLYSPSETHKFVFSTGMIRYDQTLHNSPELSFIPGYNPTATSAHLGGEYTLALEPKDLKLSFGLTGNYDSYSDSIAGLPSARIMFSPQENSRAWFAYSSSSRTIPSGLTEIENMRNGYLPVGPLTIPTPFGNFEIDKQLLNIVWQDGINIEKERLDAFEIGYRSHQANGGSFMITAFANKYKNIIGVRDYNVAPILTVPAPYLLNEILFDNVANGESYGLETSKNWILGKNKSLTLNYSYVTDSFTPLEEYRADYESRPLLQAEILSLNNNVPTHQGSIWYAQTIGSWRMDLGLRYADGFEGPRSKQKESFQSDVRFTWSKSENLQISIVGRNLLNTKADETFLKDFIGFGSEVPHEAYFEVNLKF